MKDPLCLAKIHFILIRNWFIRKLYSAAEKVKKVQHLRKFENVYRFKI